MRRRIVVALDALLSTLKHEFGHGFLQTGDGYVTDFQREDDDGNPLYGYLEVTTITKTILILVTSVNL